MFSSRIYLLLIPINPGICGSYLNVEFIYKLLIYYNFSTSEDIFYKGKSVNIATLKLDNRDKCIKFEYLSNTHNIFVI